MSPPPAHFTSFPHDVFYFSLLHQNGSFSYTGWSSKTFNENLWVSDNESLSPHSVKSDYDLLLHCIELHSQNTNMCTITEHNGSHTTIESSLRLSHFVYMYIITHVFEQSLFSPLISSCFSTHYQKIINPLMSKLDERRMGCLVIFSVLYDHTY